MKALFQAASSKVEPEIKDEISSSGDPAEGNTGTDDANGLEDDFTEEADDPTFVPDEEDDEKPEVPKTRKKHSKNRPKGEPRTRWYPGKRIYHCEFCREVKSNFPFRPLCTFAFLPTLHYFSNTPFPGNSGEEIRIPMTEIYWI